MNKIFIGLTILLFSFNILAYQVDTNKEIENVAVEAGNKGYLKVDKTSTPLTLSCTYDVIFFDLTTDTGKGHLSILLAAKLSGTKISILSYEQDTAGKCTLSTVTI